jgi:hypothetical protein
VARDVCVTLLCFAVAGDYSFEIYLTATTGYSELSNIFSCPAPQEYNSTSCENKRLAAFQQVVIQQVAMDFLFVLARQLPVGHGLLILEVSRPHTTTHHIR